MDQLVLDIAECASVALIQAAQELDEEERMAMVYGTFATLHECLSSIAAEMEERYESDSAEVLRGIIKSLEELQSPHKIEELAYIIAVALHPLPLLTSQSQ